MAQGRKFNAEDFWASVDKKPGGCWKWMGGRHEAGYGWVTVDYQHMRAHRVAYVLLRGPIPDGLHLDHLCRNRACVNPDHLEPVTSRENILRGIGPTAKNAQATACPQGHPYDEANTYVRRCGRRACRECQRIRARQYKARRRAAARAAKGEAA